MRLLTIVIPALALTLAACASTTPAEQASAPAQAAPAPATDIDAALAAAVGGSWRDPKNTARDPHRHPQQTLAFFGVTPQQTVIEITPGGGWYAEVLAPYLREQGHYVAAVWDDAIAGQPKYRYDLTATLRKTFAGNAAV